MADLSLPENKIDFLKQHKRIIIPAVLLIAILAAAVYVFLHRPVFSASHSINSQDENRLINVEVKVPGGSAVTLYKERLFVQDTVAPEGSLVTANSTDTQQADSGGKALFRLFPGELKLGANQLRFEVRVPLGIKKVFNYSVEKPQLPITLKVKAEDGKSGQENIKTVTVITDPLNTVSVNGMVNNASIKTGKERFQIRDYDLLQSAGLKPENTPDRLEASILVSAMDVDGRRRIEKIPVMISSLTVLTVDQPAETDGDTATITGKASPGAEVRAGGKSVTGDPAGQFMLAVPLPVLGENKIDVTAGRPPEKMSTRTVTVNKKMPPVYLKVDSSTVNGSELTIKGICTFGASVAVNGEPARVEENRFSYTCKLPAGISKDQVFTVKAEKPGYAGQEERVTLQKLPVFRQ